MLPTEPRLLKYMRLASRPTGQKLSPAAQALIVYSLTGRPENDPQETPATCTALVPLRKQGIFFIRRMGAGRGKK